MRIDGGAALRLEFGGATTTTGGRAGRQGLRLAPGPRNGGPDKYKALEQRRRRAQIRARHLLDLMEEAR